MQFTATRLSTAQPDTFRQFLLATWRSLAANWLHGGCATWRVIDHIDRDALMLIEQIRTRVLLQARHCSPRRDEISSPLPAKCPYLLTRLLFLPPPALCSKTLRSREAINTFAFADAGGGAAPGG